MRILKSEVAGMHDDESPQAQIRALPRQLSDLQQGVSDISEAL
jgi:hypothetical protein